MTKFVTEKSGPNFVTRSVSLTSASLPEISVEFRDSRLLHEGENFVRFVANYLTSSGRQIRPGETMAYGYWLVKFQASGTHSNELETWEYNAEGADFVRGANLTLSYWLEQHQVCSIYGAEFKPPRPDKLTVVSAGVLEGLLVEGVRYPSPDHMSGWWLTTEQYNGDVKSLRNQHTYHVTAARPDLAKYLALPEGFRFNTKKEGVEVWFDEGVAKERG